MFKYNANNIDDTEYEIQHQAHTLLEREGFVVRGEFPWPNEYLGKNCRLDLVVFSPDATMMLCILECKTDDAPPADDQIERYAAQFPTVPVIEVRGMKGALGVVKSVKAAIEAYRNIRQGKPTREQVLAAKQGMYRAPNYKGRS